MNHQHYPHSAYSTTPVKRGRFDQDSKGFKRKHSFVSFTDISRNRFQSEENTKAQKPSNNQTKQIAWLTQQLENIKVENRKEMDQMKQEVEEYKSRLSIVEDICVNKAEETSKY
mmetsp:Transcript_15458/g.23486  ORF Transcript_15458/g.23486 Transcript_15458/m.23486 type:complete len:114 (-) Transcript_15458:1783-2124(-)